MAVDAGNVVGGTATGAAAGSMFGPIGTAIGAGVGAIGAVASGLLGVGATQREPTTYKVDPNAYNLNPPGIGVSVPGAGGIQGITVMSPEERSKYEHIAWYADPANEGKIIEDFGQMMYGPYWQARSDADKARVEAAAHDWIDPARVQTEETNRRINQALEVGYAQGVDVSGQKAVENIGNLQQQYMQQGQAAQGRQAYGIGGAYNAIAPGALQSTNTMLTNAATGAVPSVAELQGQQQMQQANANAVGLAAGGQTPAARALGMRTAIQGFGQNAAQSAQAQAIARAGEMAQARGALAGFQTGVAGQQLQSELAQRQANDEMMRSLYGYGLSAEELQERSRQASIQQGLAVRQAQQQARQSEQELRAGAFNNQAQLSYQTGVNKAQAGANAVNAGMQAVSSAFQYGQQQGLKGGSQ